MPLPASLPFLGAVPEDECIRRADIEARSFLDLPDAPAFAALAECLDKLGIDAGGRAACTAGRHSA